MLCDKNDAIVNVTALLDPAEVPTITLPVVAPLGTVVEIEVSLHEVTVAEVPLKVTVPVVVPKPVPEIATAVPTVPEVGDSELIAGSTEKATPALARPSEAVTTTLPEVAAAGTVAVIEVLLQDETVALVPLKLTLPPLAPRPVPVIVMVVPVTPAPGDSDEIAGPTLNGMPLLAPALVVTTTFPEVAAEGTLTAMEVLDQLDIVATTPLKVTEPVVLPKPVPDIATVVPVVPEVGAREAT